MNILKLRALLCTIVDSSCETESQLTTRKLENDDRVLYQCLG